LRPAVFRESIPSGTGRADDECNGGTEKVKASAGRTALATWTAVSLIVGVTLGFLRLTNVPSDRVLDGDDIAVAAVVTVGWSLLTFVCGAPVVWATVAHRARVLARRARRYPARRTHAGTGMISGDPRRAGAPTQ
jgi:hypothetical protein